MKFYDYYLSESKNVSPTFSGTLIKEELIKLVETFTTFSTSYISDCLDRLSGEAILRICEANTNQTIVIKEANSIERDAGSTDNTES